MAFDKLNQCTIGVFNIAEAAGGTSHSEGLAAVYSKRKSSFRTFLSEVIHSLNIEAEMYESQITPETVLKYSPGTPG